MAQRHQIAGPKVTSHLRSNRAQGASVTSSSSSQIAELSQYGHTISTVRPRLEANSSEMGKSHTRHRKAGALMPPSWASDRRTPAGFLSHVSRVQDGHLEDHHNLPELAPSR